MKKPLYLHLPEAEYMRLKIHSAAHCKSMQSVVRSAINEYLNANKYKDLINETNLSKKDT